MARYIDADLLLKDIKESVVFSVRDAENSPELRGARKIIDRIENAPTADVVEVVRCKDCKNYHKYLTIGGFFRCECVLNEECVTSVHEMHFCSYGERKDAE